ncbi:MAG: FAD/FMN-containing dehydrogenase/Fe-S oxidoreductase [Salibacteraceae bacterium]
MKKYLLELSQALKGDLKTDDAVRIIYATDASAYRELPLAVAIPKDKNDIKLLIEFANTHQVGLIPRTAGTSLAGQVVGSGIVVDVSPFFTSILEFNAKENWVRVEPGVIRDELNYFLKPHGCLFGPETSTSNRAMIGGMVGNNSCGSNSIVYGSTRDHLLEITGFLSNGQEVVFNALTQQEFERKLNLPKENLEGQIYRHIYTLLKEKEKQSEIISHYPNPKIKRRNTGYALDLLQQADVFNSNTEKFNFCKLIAGSEGTLIFITEIKVNVDPLPPKAQGLLVAHFDSLDDSLQANLIALKYNPYAVELMDNLILDCTIGHPMYEKYRFFLKGEPKAILAIQLHASTEDELHTACEKLIHELKDKNYGFHYPVLKGGDISKVWALRKAGLGLLANIAGKDKAVPVIEDTCVTVEDLPNYIEEFGKQLKSRGLSCVHYAHAGTGELHLRPMINLKTSAGAQLFKDVAQDIATLVKKYKGSLSGEHGDGRLRGEFISQMVGPTIYQDFVYLKKVWDPNNILNPGKIVNTPEMNKSLRYAPDVKTPTFNTAFDFSKNGGFLESVELCNGSADCRKTELTGGTMCPSYMATRDEAHTTRSRANTLRELMTQREDLAFTSPELEQSMELCLMCKGCKMECPSNVDMATYKSEYLFQKFKINSPSFTQKKMAHFSNSMELVKTFSPISNWVLQSPLKNTIKKVMGISIKREIPIPEKTSLFEWYKIHQNTTRLELLKSKKSEVLFFCDEFTNYLDVDTGIAALKLLWTLGYDAKILAQSESGRTAISKGFLTEAKALAVHNVTLFQAKVSPQIPLIGIEPSTILSFRDEYPNLIGSNLKEKATILGKSSLLIEEFLCQEIDKGNISEQDFNPTIVAFQIHGHCHQKALSSVTFTKRILSLPTNATAKVIPSGCCGMAGSFGYEQYETSMKIGELVLFPAIRKKAKNVITVAPGTSCRQQIKDGVNADSKHPVQVLWDLVKK